MNASLVKYLESNTEILATEITERMEEERPQLFRRYRDRSLGQGRDPAEWCKEDTIYHLRHLAAALDSDDPEEFQEYRSWLLRVMGARDIPEEDIDANFEAMADALRARLGDEAAPAVSMLNVR